MRLRVKEGSKEITDAYACLSTAIAVLSPSLSRPLTLLHYDNMATPNDETVLPIPNLNLTQSTFILSSSKTDSASKATASTALLAGIIADGPFLSHTLVGFFH